MLELAGDLGLQGVLFELSPFSSFRDADLEQIRQTAQRRGLYVEMGMGSIFHWHPMAAKGRELLAEAGLQRQRLRRPDRHPPSPGRQEAGLALVAVRGGQPFRLATKATT